MNSQREGGGVNIANEATWGGIDVINLLKLRWEVKALLTY